MFKSVRKVSRRWMNTIQLTLSQLISCRDVVLYNCNVILSQSIVAWTESRYPSWVCCSLHIYIQSIYRWGSQNLIGETLLYVRSSKKMFISVQKKFRAVGWTQFKLTLSQLISCRARGLYNCNLNLSQPIVAWIESRYPSWVCCALHIYIPSIYRWGSQRTAYGPRYAYFHAKLLYTCLFVFCITFEV